MCYEYYFYNWKAIPDSLKPYYENTLKGNLTSPLVDKQDVEGFFGIEVIATPGHTLDTEEALASAAKLVDYEIDSNLLSRRYCLR